MARSLRILFLTFLFIPAFLLAAEPEFIPTGHEAGERFVLTVGEASFPFRWAPAGEFTMGSPETEPDRDPAEILHSVTLTRGFWILETEVTQKMFQAVTGENPSSFRGENLPVDSVSWGDALAFCAQLTEILSKEYLCEKWDTPSFRAQLTDTLPPPDSILVDLPTEAEWEYACRAGSTGPYPGELDQIAWTGEPTETGSPHPVGTKNPNAWGIFDMTGNLWEWTRDHWFDFTTDPAIDPTGPEIATGNVRIDRGGCWDSKPTECRSAYRGVYEEKRQSRFVGFRIILRFKGE